MLTLLEPPGAKRSQNVSNFNNRSAQHLLNLAPDDEELYESYEEGDEFVDRAADGNFVSNFLDSKLVWKSSSGDYCDRWKREFRARPSWCDADLCLQQIKRGRAKGNQWALYSRSFIQKLLYALGNAVHRNALLVIFSVCISFAFCCYGLQYVHIETDIVKLWVSQGGRLDEELNFLSKVKESSAFNTSENGPQLPRQTGLGGGYQVIIQTPEYEGQNALEMDSLLKHVDIMKEIASFQIDLHGENWTLSDICFKPSAPDIGDKSPVADISHIIDRIVPCIWITPIDCFWEGSKALGPHPTLKKLDIGAMTMTLNTLAAGPNIKWSNFDPLAVITEIHNTFNLGTHYSFFQRVGIGHGYMDRPCIDPFDADCPPLAPNYYDVCPHLETIRRVAGQYGFELEKEVLEEDPSIFDFFGFRGKRAAKGEMPPANETAAVAAAVPEAVQTTAASPKTTTRNPVLVCREYRRSALAWLKINKDKWSEVMKPDQYPQPVDYGTVMAEGCNGFARDVLHWPKEMILGGTRKVNGTGPGLTASALQSVFLVASPQDVYLRFKNKPGRKSQKSSLTNSSVWDEDMAKEVIQTWQRNFTKNFYNHAHNKDATGAERRTLHPLASTSIADMLEEFCQFNYTIIFVGYALMLLYAIVTQSRTERMLPSSESFMGLAFAGVMVVTFASVAGLGLATWFGIEFNAATTQIVPFLTLGIGVDNMFMLLHNYRDLLKMSGGRNEIGILMRETGMSILCTSINNILSFLTGTLLPIPALRSFCAQSSILLTFNFIAILTLYPAIIAIDLRRRKSGRRDIFCCFYGEAREESYSMISKPQIPTKRIIGANDISIMQPFDAPSVHHHHDEPVPYSLHAFLRYYYIPFISTPCMKVLIILLCGSMLGGSIMGMQKSSLGLELSDVLPAHTAPAQFLRARDKYFSFYPMFAVLKGPNIDYPRQQRQIINYRQAIASSDYVIKNSQDEPSEKFWLGLMRDWLQNIQVQFDNEWKRGAFHPVEGTIVLSNVTEDAKIAHSLICSVGNEFRCKGRVGIVRLIDNSNIINVDSFYNCLTAWYNVDNMMYYVSQASFYPAPPKWSLGNDPMKNFVPPAEPLAYSQIPFYLTGLTDTPVIVSMIEEIRDTCKKFSDRGLPNFPQGIAFTFWEQYLYLTGNLMQAIGIITLAVFVVISILLFNPWAAAIIVVILTVMTVELAGFMGWMGIKLNPVSAVTLITAVGIGVEFTVHVVVSFLTSLGTRSQRTSQAVDRVFVPVIHGSFSTLLGILMLGFSEFEFVVKYFFIVMTALIVTGVINGLVLLPVLLSLFGPPREISPTDGRDRLALPPSLRRRGFSTSHPHGDSEDDEPSGLVMYPGRSGQTPSGKGVKTTVA